MARLKTNILDGGSGTIGNVVMYQWRGISCMRSKPSYYHDKKSIAQLRQRQKMTLVHSFLRCFVPYLNDTFYENGIGRSPYQSAQSYNLKYGISGNYPNQYVDLRKALIAKGDLPLPNNLRAVKSADQLIISWDIDNELSTNLQHNGLRLYWNRADGTSHAKSINTKVKRIEGQYILDLIPLKYANEINIWAVFFHTQNKEISNSQLLL